MSNTETREWDKAAAQDMDKALEAIEREPVYDKVSDTGKKYYYREPGVRVYESGAIYNENTKKLSGNPKAQITADNASQLQVLGVEQRHENRLRKAIAGAELAIKDKRDAGEIPKSIERLEEAWGYSVAETMLAGGKNNMSAARLAGEVTGLIGRKGEDVPAGEVRITATMSIAEFRNRVAGERQADGGDKSNYRNHDNVIDGEVSDSSE